MTKERYEKLAAPLNKSKKRADALLFINSAFTLLIYIAYPSLLLFLFVSGSEKLLRCILVPGISFISVSALRKIINRSRPYEKLGFSPLIKKEKRGESMPSRHVFSVFVIGMTFMFIRPVLSVPFFVIGTLLAVIRVIGGVHYPSDVIVGAAIGILSGIIGFYVI